MKVSKLLAASLTVVSVLALSASNADARNSSGKGGGGFGCAPTLGVTEVFPSECGSDPGTVANFQPTTGFPLVATVNEQSTLFGGYAGALIFTPNANNISNLTDLSLYTPIPQGTYSQTITVFAGNVGSGSPFIEQALAYSWQTTDSVTHYGITFVPFSFITGAQQFNNQALKNKSAIVNVTTDTVLLDLYNAGKLGNLIGTAPGVDTNTSTFQLLGIASALVNDGAAGTSVTASFNNFSINNPVFSPPGAGNLAKALCPDGSSVNINCSPFIPTGSTPAATAARSR